MYVSQHLGKYTAIFMKYDENLLISPMIMIYFLLQLSIPVSAVQQCSEETDNSALDQHAVFSCSDKYKCKC
jgi:hypothetical protein